MGRVLYIAEIDGDTSFQHVTIKEFDETKGYITISARDVHKNDRNRALLYKYSQGVLYEEIEEYSRDDQRFKTIFLTRGLLAKTYKEQKRIWIYWLSIPKAGNYSIFLRISANLPFVQHWKEMNAKEEIIVINLELLIKVSLKYYL